MFHIRITGWVKWLSFGAKWHNTAWYDSNGHLVTASQYLPIEKDIAQFCQESDVGVNLQEQKEKILIITLSIYM